MEQKIEAKLETGDVREGSKVTAVEMNIQYPHSRYV